METEPIHESILDSPVDQNAFWSLAFAVPDDASALYPEEAPDEECNKQFRNVPYKLFATTGPTLL